MQTPRVVVLATDGGADAAVARRAAGTLCRAWEAQLHVVHAWQPPVVPYDYPGQAVPVAWEPVYEHAHQDILTAECRALGDEGCSVAGSHVVMDDSVAAIVHTAEEVGADLVIVGSGGHHAVGRLLLGSVSTGVVHQATVPVLVVRPEAVWPPRTVAIGDDLTASAERTGEVALAIAGASRAAVSLVHAMALLSEDDGFTGPADRAPSLERLTARTAQRAAALAEGAVAVRPLTVVGDPAATLLRAAPGADGLVCVGRHRRRFVHIGSVSNAVLHRAHGAVLVGPAIGHTDEVPAAGGAGRLLVRDVMSAKVVTCQRYEAVRTVAQRMVEEAVGALPVMSLGQVVGMVTDRDLVMRCLASGGSDAAVRHVAPFMSEPVVTIAPDARLDAALQAMHVAGVHRLPVLDAAGTLVGICSRTDLAAAGVVAFTGPARRNGHAQVTGAASSPCAEETAVAAAS